MATPAYKFIPVASAWASPALEKQFNAIDAELNTFPAELSFHEEERYGLLRKARDLIEEADCELALAGWDR